jgi:hypothetical protein
MAGDNVAYAPEVLVGKLLNPYYTLHFFLVDGEDLVKTNSSNSSLYYSGIFLNFHTYTF